MPRSTPVVLTLVAAVCLGWGAACRLVPHGHRPDQDGQELRERRDADAAGALDRSSAARARRSEREEREEEERRAKAKRREGRHEDEDGEHEEHEEDEEGEDPPGLWFYAQRMGSDGSIPLRARADAYEEVRLMEGGRRALRMTVDDPSEADAEGDPERPGERGSGDGLHDVEVTGWTPAGPTLVGGRASALAADPNDPTHAWLGTADGGVFKTVDGGVTWTPVFDAQPNLSIGAIAAHPTNSNIVYVGTGEEAGGGYSYDGDGIYRTTDGGVTWQNMGLADVRRIGKIAIDPVHPQRVFVAAGGGVFSRDSNRGVYRSLDGGVTWQKVLYVADDSGAVDVAIDPSDPNRIYAAIWTRYSSPFDIHMGGLNSGIWRSTNGGTTWTRLTSGLPAQTVDSGRIGLAIAPSSPQTVYAIYRDHPGFLVGIWKTTNAGVSWQRIDNGSVVSSFSSMGYYFGQIRVDPSDPDTVYALDASVWKSTDGGVRWTSRVRNVHDDHHDMVLLPGGRGYLANDGGAYWTTSGADNWTKTSVLPISQIYDIGIAKTNPLVRLAGLQDNGTVRTTTGSASAWSQVLGNDGTQCEVDPVDGSRVYASYQAGNIFRSTNGGGSFTGAKSGIDPSDRVTWSVPIVHDPVHTQRLFTGTSHVYRSTNGASSWTQISPDLNLGTFVPHDHDEDNDPTSPPGHVTGSNHGMNSSRNRANNHTATIVQGAATTIGVSPVNTQIVWAGTDAGNVWVTPNDGASWSHVPPSSAVRWVTRIACDPFDAMTAYVTLSGYQTGERLPHVFKTTNLGSSWTDISANLPQAPVNAIVPDPASPGRLLVGTDVGVFMTQNGGATWFPLSTGLPHVVVMDLLLHDSTRTLFAATYGRSLYSYDLSQLVMTDTDGDGVPNASDCAPGDGGAYAAPADVVMKASANDDLVVWGTLDVQAGPGTGYDVMRGLVSELPLPARSSDACLATGLVAGSLTDTERPAPGELFFYMVRARNACGAGTWGTASNGAQRIVTGCP